MTLSMNEHTVGHIGEIPCGEGRTFAVNGCQIAVFRLRDDSLRALDAVCPHRGGPLADALIDDQIVVCPLHGYSYDLNTGLEVAGNGDAVSTYPVRADERGRITVDMD
jgi:nitrite reductase (NADH) small subunit